MSGIAMNIAKMVDMLPENEQNFASEFIKRLILAWNPDFTKTTEEAAQIAEAENGEFFSESEIDWEHLERYAE